MDSRRLFRNVWRVNALLIMGATVIGMVVLVYAAHMIVGDVFGTRHVRNVTSVAPGAERMTVRRYGRAESLPGTPYVMIPVFTGQSYRHRHYAKDVSALENMCFVNGETLESRMLFSGESLIILEHAVLGEQGAFRSPEKAECILYVIVRSDTSSDDRLSPSDMTEIACSAPDGGGYTVLADSVDEYLGYSCEDGRCVVMFRRGEGLFAVSFKTDAYNTTIRERRLDSGA